MPDKADHLIKDNHAATRFSIFSTPADNPSEEIAKLERREIVDKQHAYGVMNEFRDYIDRGTMTLIWNELRVAALDVLEANCPEIMPKAPGSFMPTPFTGIDLSFNPATDVTSRLEFTELGSDPQVELCGTICRYFIEASSLYQNAQLLRALKDHSQIMNTHPFYDHLLEIVDDTCLNPASDEPAAATA